VLANFPVCKPPDNIIKIRSVALSCSTFTPRFFIWANQIEVADIFRSSSFILFVQSLSIVNCLIVANCSLFRYQSSYLEFRSTYCLWVSEIGRAVRAAGYKPKTDNIAQTPQGKALPRRDDAASNSTSPYWRHFLNRVVRRRQSGVTGVGISLRVLWLVWHVFTFNDGLAWLSEMGHFCIEN